MFFNAFSLFTPATGPVYNRAHTPINLGYVTGNYYQTGIVQECLCIKLPLFLLVTRECRGFPRLSFL